MSIKACCYGFLTHGERCLRKFKMRRIWLNTVTMRNNVLSFYGVGRA